MKKVRVFLRTIKDGNENKLMLYDSNRNGAINNLVTIAHAGSKVIWRCDRRSGIKRILSVTPKSKDGKIFRTHAKRCWFFNIFYLRIPGNVKGEEAYNIEYLRFGKEKVTIDPVLKVPPPLGHGTG